MSLPESRNPIPRFHDGPKDDFVLWKLRIMTELEDNNCLNIVLGTETGPTEETGFLANELFSKRKKKAMSILIKGLGDKPLKSIQRYASDPVAAWAKLLERYASKTSSTRMMLLNELLHLKLNPSVDMTDHIATFELTLSKLSAAGYDLDKLLQVTLLLSSISGSPDYEPTVAAIRTMDEDKATWEAVCSRLIDESKERAAASAAEANLALSTMAPTNRGPRMGHQGEHYSGNSRNNNNSSQHRQPRQRNRGRRSFRQPYQGSRDDSNNRSQGNNNNNNNNSSNSNNNRRNGSTNDGANSNMNNSQPRLAVLRVTEHRDATACTAAASDGPADVDFIVDSGASHHMFQDASLFSSLSHCGSSTVSLGDKLSLIHI